MKVRPLTTAAVLVVTVASLVTGFETAYARTQAAATKAGWWIKVSTNDTEATSIAFDIGRRERDREQWRTWSSGDPAEFDLPDNFQQLPRLYLRASADPTGEKASLCLMYKDRGVKRFVIDSSEAQMKEQTDTDAECK